MMLDQNKELFASFKKVQSEYEKDPDSTQEKLNKQGEKVMLVIRNYENKLCGTTERGGFGSFSGKLAEKFQNEVRKAFPKIDYIGIIVKKPEKEFVLKKINLS